MSVEHVTYKKKRLPVKLGYYALKMLQKEKGASMEQIQEDIALYEPLLFYSLERGHKIQKKELTLTMEDMEDVLEECFFEFIGLIPNFFPDVEKLMAGEGKNPRKK
jgi:hypothetical protein